jgi:hypothetical protein
MNMAYGGMSTVGFDDLENLMYLGTDVICVEKQGTVIKMVPFIRNNGVALSSHRVSLVNMALR